MERASYRKDPIIALIFEVAGFISLRLDFHVNCFSLFHAFRNFDGQEGPVELALGVKDSDYLPNAWQCCWRRPWAILLSICSLRSVQDVRGS